MILLLPPAKSQAALAPLFGTLLGLHQNSSSLSADQTTLSQANHWLKFCYEMQIPDGMLSSVQGYTKANLLFGMYAAHLALGHTLLCQTIKSDTICWYLQAAATESIGLQHLL